MPSKLERFFDLRPGDLHRGIYLALYYFFVINAYTNGQVVRDALFLERFEAVRLPYVDFLVAALVGGVLAIYFRIGRKMPLVHLLAATLCFFAANVLLFWWVAMFRQSEWLYPVVYVWVGIFGVLGMSQVWTLTNFVLTGREAKRLIGFIGTGGIIGGITGGFLSNIVALAIGAESLFLIMAASLAIATCMVFKIASMNGSSATALNSSPAINSEGSATLRESFRLVVSSRHLLLIAALICTCSVATYIAGWQLRAIVQDSLPNKVAIASFLGNFHGTTAILAMLIQVFLTPRLLRHVGIRAALSILPLTLIAGTGALLASGMLWAATFLKGTDKVVRYSVDNAALQLLFLPVSPETKVQAKAFLDTVVLRGGDGLGAVVVLLLTAVAGLGATQLGWVVLALLFVWIVIAWQAGSQYVATLGDTLRQHRMDAERLQEAPLDRSATKMLVTGLRTDDPEKILYMLDLLEGQHWKDAYSSIRELLSHPAPEVRAKATSILRRLGDTSVIPRIEELVVDADLNVRIEALLFLVQLTGVDPLSRIQDLGDFPDFSIQAATTAFLARSEDPSNLEGARLILAGMINDRTPAGTPGRLEAARLLRMLPETFATYLLPLLADEDLTVLREATRTASNRPSRQYVSSLIALLGKSEMKDAAVKALSQYGENIQGTLRDHLSDNTVPLEAKREIPDLLVSVAKRAARDPLLANITHPDNVLRFRIIAALNKLHNLYPDLQLDTTTIEAVLASEIMHHYRAFQIIGRMDDQRQNQSFDTPLQKSLHNELERIFRLLKMLYPRHDLRSAFVGLESGNKAAHDSALEFIDNTLKPSIRRLLVPLLDSEISLTERVELANRLLPSTIDSRDDAVLALMDTEDPWLKSCAAHLIGMLGLKQFQETVDRWASDHDPVLREKAQRAQQRLAEATSP
jgi:AAA family ATP:ADP antiporter